MAERTIKHAQFVYSVEQEAPDRSGEMRPRLGRRVAMQGETVDIPREEDIERGEEFGAFMTDEDFAAEAEGEEEEEEPEPESEPVYDQLVIWIRDEKPTATKVIAEAKGDPDRANMLMDAEEEASGGHPRKTVMTELEKIASG
jgi:hypothetical protein